MHFILLAIKKKMRKTSKLQNKYKHEIGKTCNTGAMTTLIAMLVTPRVTGQSLSTYDYVSLVVVALSFGILGYLFLLENKPEPKGDGKWKRVRVKKDTTIHVMEEAEE